MNRDTFEGQLQLLHQLFPFFLVISSENENQENTILHVGKSIQKLFPQEVIGQNFDDILHITTPIFARNLKESLHFSREVFIVTYKHNPSIALKGQISLMPQTNHYLFTGNPLIKNAKTIKALNLNNNDFAIFDSLPEYLFAVQTQETSLRDATEMSKKLNRQTQELKKANEELLTLSRNKDELLASILEKNEELERFAHIASHDLKQPLNSVINFAHLLRMSLALRKDSDEMMYLNYILSGSKQMMQLIEDLLEYSKLNQSRDHITAVDLNQIIQEVRHSMLLQIQERNVQIIIPTPLPILNYNKHRVYLLFKNIIGNGIKYNKSEQPTIRIEHRAEGEFVIITISDNGIGIEEKYFSRIFKMFSRLENHSQYEGTGLGLSLCKKIVNNMGGEISVTSQYGAGSQFHLTIPKSRFLKNQASDT